MFDCPYLIEILTPKRSNVERIEDQMKTLVVRTSKYFVHFFPAGRYSQLLGTEQDLQRQICLGGRVDELLQQLRLESGITSTTRR